MSKPPEKPTYFVTGRKNGAPTLDQLVALTRRLTGRDDTGRDRSSPTGFAFNIESWSWDYLQDHPELIVSDDMPRDEQGQLLPYIGTMAL